MNFFSKDICLTVLHQYLGTKKKRSLTGKMKNSYSFHRHVTHRQFSSGYTQDDATKSSHYTAHMTNHLLNHLLLLVKYKTRKIVNEQLFHNQRQ